MNCIICIIVVEWIVVEIKYLLKCIKH